MAMEIEWANEKYIFELEDATTEQLIKIYQVYELDILGLAQGQQRGDIRALVCVWWLMQVQNGKNLLRLEAVTIDKPVKFATAVMAGLLKEREELLAKAEKAIAEDKKKAPKE